MKCQPYPLHLHHRPPPKPAHPLPIVLQLGLVVTAGVPREAGSGRRRSGTRSTSGRLSVFESNHHIDSLWFILFALAHSSCEIDRVYEFQDAAVLSVQESFSWNHKVVGQRWRKYLCLIHVVTIHSCRKYLVIYILWHDLYLELPSKGRRSGNCWSTMVLNFHRWKTNCSGGRKRVTKCPKKANGSLNITLPQRRNGIRI